MRSGMVFCFVVLCHSSIPLVLADDREEFLAFVSEATERYRSSIMTGEYDILTQRPTFFRLEKVQFRELESVIEMSSATETLSDADCQYWQDSGKFPRDIALNLIGVRGETSDYRYSLLFKDGSTVGSTISNLEVFSDNMEGEIVPTAIYAPFALGGSGFAADSVRAGTLQVLSWGLDEKSGLWLGKFRDVRDSAGGYEMQAYFDSDDRRIRKWFLFYDQSVISMLENEYKDGELYRARNFVPSKSPGDEAMVPHETFYYGKLSKKQVDSSTFRLGHYGHPEPALPMKKRKWDNGFTFWVIIPALGVIALMLARQINRKKGL
jgi:hypothetical protein